MNQIANNNPEQAMLGDFPKAIDDAVMDSNEVHQNQMMQLLSDPTKAAHFSRIVFDLLKMYEPGKNSPGFSAAGLEVQIQLTVKLKHSIQTGNEFYRLAAHPSYPVAALDRA